MLYKVYMLYKQIISVFSLTTQIFYNMTYGKGERAYVSFLFQTQNESLPFKISTSILL